MIRLNWKSEIDKMANTAWQKMHDNRQKLFSGKLPVWWWFSTKKPQEMTPNVVPQSCRSFSEPVMAKRLMNAGTRGSAHGESKGCCRTATVCRHTLWTTLKILLAMILVGKLVVQSTKSSPGFTDLRHCRFDDEHDNELWLFATKAMAEPCPTGWWTIFEVSATSPALPAQSCLIAPNQHKCAGVTYNQFCVVSSFPTSHRTVFWKLSCLQTTKISSTTNSSFGLKMHHESAESVKSTSCNSLTALYPDAFWTMP